MLFGKLRGGLAVSVVVVGAMLGASTGIVGATVVTMGLLSLPTMIKRGYSPELATGTISASGTLGQIIPPSIVLVLLGSILNVSIGDMFIGAVIPGAILVSLYLVWIAITSTLRPETAPAMPAEELSRFRSEGMIKKILQAFVLPFMLVVGVLGSIFAGIASPTEAAAVGAFLATLLTILRKRFSLDTLRGVMRETTLLTSMVFTILVGATAFGLVFRGMGGDRQLTQLIVEANLGPNTFLALVMLVIFVAGFFIDFIEITFIIVPVVAPIFVNMDINLLWIGVLIAMNLQTSFLTPPFGFSLFYLKGVAPEGITTMQIYKGIIPFVIIQLVGLLVLLLFPDTVTWLPRVTSR
jgi:tripartite ATP-independent transporter DctM subunit